MSAAVYNMYIDQGSDYFLTLTLKDADGNKVDLTGFTFAGQIRQFISSPTVLASFAFNILPQAVPATLGQVVVSLPKAASSALPVIESNSGDSCKNSSTFVYDIEATADGITQRWLQGKVILSPEVTRV